MVKRRAKAAIASGGQNLASARIKLALDIEVQERKVADVAERIERAAKNGNEDQMDHLEVELNVGCKTTKGKEYYYILKSTTYQDG